MVRSFLRSFRSLFLYPSNQKLSTSILVGIVLTILYLWGLSTLKTTPSSEYMGQIASWIMMAAIGLILFYVVFLILLRFQHALFSANKNFEQRLKELFVAIFFSIVLGLSSSFLFFLYFFMVWGSGAYPGKRLGYFNYPNYGKTIYVYAEKQCFFDCSLYSSFWLQSGRLPLMHKLDMIQIDHNYIPFASQQKEKAFYDTYLKTIKEENGVLKIPLNSFYEGYSYLYYNLKTGKTWKGNK